MKRILLAGGGTGGHITPLLAVKEALENKGEFKFMMIGSGLSDPGFKFKNILTGKWRRYPDLKNFLDLIKIPLGMLQALWSILWFMPNVCFAKGGYASVPTVIACRLLFIPIIIHDSDSVPGVSNKLLAYLAKKICLAYSGAEKYFYKPEKIVFTGNPVKKSIIKPKIKNNRPVILAMGGSQGSRFINEMILALALQLLERADVLHQVGRGNLSGTKLAGYQETEFIEDMGEAYAKADLVITRAGANSLAEISANKKPAIIIPLPNSAQDHQLKNAYAYAQNGAASVFEEENLGPLTLYKDIIFYLDQPFRAKKMGEHAGEMNASDA